MPVQFAPAIDTDPHTERPQDDAVPKRPTRHHVSDLIVILIKASAFLGSIYLGVLGLPLLIFLALAGGDMTVFFAQLGNLASHYLDADAAARAAFLSQVRLGLFGMATLIALWRLPRFLDDIGATLAPLDDLQ